MSGNTGERVALIKGHAPGYIVRYVDNERAVVLGGGGGAEEVIPGAWGVTDELFDGGDHDGGVGGLVLAQQAQLHVRPGPPARGHPDTGSLHGRTGAGFSGTEGDVSRLVIVMKIPVQLP